MGLGVFLLGKIVGWYPPGGALFNGCRVMGGLVARLDGGRDGDEVGVVSFSVLDGVGNPVLIDEVGSAVTVEGSGVGECATGDGVVAVVDVVGRSVTVEGLADALVTDDMVGVDV